jgi:tetratricopeptide (TPR) repeat protein
MESMSFVDRQNRIFLVVGLLSLVLCVVLQRIWPAKPAADAIVFEFNEEIPTFSASVYRSLLFGYDALAGNLLWIRFLHRSPVEKVPPGQYSWVYLDMDTISTIDPNFEEVFEAGGIFTSVIVEDKEGARKLLEKGVSLHPNNWRIRANLAYHYRNELNLPELAEEQNLAASRIPGAPWIFSVAAAGSLERTGRNELAIRLLKEVLESVKSEEGRKRIEARIRELEGG